MALQNVRSVAAFSFASLHAGLFIVVVAPDGSVAYWTWFAAWFGAFVLASLLLALGSAEAGFQHYCSRRRCCCGFWPSEENGLNEISKRREEVMVER
jgi:hypothetical protein